MKYITFAVPCYNSESYMDRCVETLLTGGNRVEIVLAVSYTHLTLPTTTSV